MHTALTDPWRATLLSAGYALADTTPGETVPVVVRDGRRSALTIVPLPDDAARDRCSEHLARWRTVDDPGVEQLDDAVDLGDAVALLRPLADRTLAEFVELQGRLSAGQASTVLVVLGRALARLHAGGLVYGPLTAADVVVVHGQPRLVVPSPQAGADHPLPASPAEDAYHLAALTDSVIVDAYGPRAPAHPAAALRALNRTIVSALGDARSRPGVGTLAALSHDVAACQPLLVLEPPSASPVPGEPRDEDPRAGGRRRRPVALAVGGLVLAVTVAGAWWGGAGQDIAARDPNPVASADGTGTPQVDGPADGPAAAAVTLTEERFDLIARLTAADPDIDARAWAEITEPGSPAHTQALDLVGELVADGASLTGLSATVDSATLLDSDASSARVEVVYATSEYAVRRAGGSVVVPASGPQAAVLTLVRTDAGWRVSAVGADGAQGVVGQATAWLVTSSGATTPLPTAASGG
ncbi:hypothetical protein [Sanguibacter sp. 25GB23B1]|uniref:hypothetical protein n=1 Tax=unclassified Sanguibacter TaxID=2645534 RepID=UPI0032AF9041